MIEATDVALSDRLIVTASHALPANDLSGWDFQGKYTSSGAGLLRKQLDHLLFVYDGLDESRSADRSSPKVVITSPHRSARPALLELICIPYLSPPVPESPVPAEWYRAASPWDENEHQADERWLDGCWWTPAAAHNVGPPALDCDYRKLRFGRPAARPALESVVDLAMYLVLFAGLAGLETTREGFRRFVGGIIAALSLMLVRVLAALSRRITTANLVLLLIAACRRFGHRDEPGGDALLACRSQSLPGTVPAM